VIAWALCLTDLKPRSVTGYTHCLKPSSPRGPHRMPQRRVVGAQPWAAKLEGQQVGGCEWASPPFLAEKASPLLGGGGGRQAGSFKCLQPEKTPSW